MSTTHEDSRAWGLNRQALLGLVVLFLAAVVFGLACGDDGDGSNEEQSVEGVITGVEAPSLTEIESFTLRSNDGETLLFRVEPDARPDPEEGFVPGHLRTHAAAAEQVEVFFREENGELLALRLVHAGQAR